jgi:hypothetical protein
VDHQHIQKSIDAIRATLGLPFDDGDWMPARRLCPDAAARKTSGWLAVDWGGWANIGYVVGAAVTCGQMYAGDWQIQFNTLANAIWCFDSLLYLLDYFALVEAQKRETAEPKPATPPDSPPNTRLHRGRTCPELSRSYSQQTV